jgi:hypothetical protein
VPVRQDTSPTLPEARFLIESVIAHPARGRVKLEPVSPVADRSFTEQVAWVVQLFAKLEHLERVEINQRRRRAVGAATSS